MTQPVLGKIEHFCKQIDDLLLVSDCSARSIEAVARIRDLANEIGIKVGRTSLKIGRASCRERV